MINIYFRFIQFSLGLYEGKEFLDGSAFVGFNWKRFYDFAKKQTLIGIIMDGITKLPKGAGLNRNVLMRWFAASQKINTLNIIMNEATAQIYNEIKDEGFSCCVLKGQGNAAMYPNPNSRTSGDIDIWVNAPRNKIRSLAFSLTKKNGKVQDESLNHIILIREGVVVELHNTPCFMANFLYNHRLQIWLQNNVEKQCENIVTLADNAGNVAIPTLSFNIIYQLHHIYHHYFYEGIGFRQILDYYFVLMNWNKDKVNIENVGELQKEIIHLGLWKFAGAMMYVLHEFMDLSEEKHIVPMDVKRGKMLLDDILGGGNFGSYYNRKTIGNHFINHNLQRLVRDARLLRYYPAEALSEPIFRLWHYLWRQKLYATTK